MLLACDRMTGAVDTRCLLLAQGTQEAGRESLECLGRAPEVSGRAPEGSGRAPGWRREDLEIGPVAMGGSWDGPGMCRGCHERFGLTFSNVLGALDALSICFTIVLASGRSRPTPVQPNRPRPSLGQPTSVVFWLVLGPRRGTFKDR